MTTEKRSHGSRRQTLAIILLGVAGLVAAAAVGHALYRDTNAAAAPATTHATTTKKPMDMPGMTTAPVTVTGATKMPGMQMPMAMTPLGQAVWQGMRIRARAMAPATFILLDDGKQKLVHPTMKDDLHLMVMLNDASSGTAIPYSSVWATIRKAGKLVYDERLWPMLSRYMGVHYGNNVALAGAGTYQLTLLISPPQAARHMEYDNRWLTPHRVTLSFDWHPKK